MLGTSKKSNKYVSRAVWPIIARYKPLPHFWHLYHLTLISSPAAHIPLRTFSGLSKPNLCLSENSFRNLLFNRQYLAFLIAQNITINHPAPIQ